MNLKFIKCPLFKGTFISWEHFVQPNDHLEQLLICGIMTSFNPDSPPHPLNIHLAIYFHISTPWIFQSELIFCLFMYSKCAVPLLWYSSHFFPMLHLFTQLLEPIEKSPLTVHFLCPSKHLVFIRCSIKQTFCLVD